MKIFLYTFLIAGLASVNISCGGSDDSSGSSSSSSNVSTATTESLSGNGVFILAGLSGNILRSTNKGASFDNATSPTPNQLRAVGY